jgi:hypothetical protein
VAEEIAEAYKMYRHPQRNAYLKYLHKNGRRDAARYLEGLMRVIHKYETRVKRGQVPETIAREKQARLAKAQKNVDKANKKAAAPQLKAEREAKRVEAAKIRGDKKAAREAVAQERAVAKKLKAEEREKKRQEKAAKVTEKNTKANRSPSGIMGDQNSESSDQHKNDKQE